LQKSLGQPDRTKGQKQEIMMTKQEIMMTLSAQYPISCICKVLDYARNNIYYHAVEKDEKDLCEEILQTA